MKKKLYTLWITTMIFLFIVSFSIAVPILVRPFYYWQVHLLHIVETSGYDFATIKVAYDEMLDFCIGIRPVFSTGILKFTEEARLHFVDCRGLFLLDFFIMGFSGLMILHYLYLHKTKKLNLERFANHSAGCNAGKLFISLAGGIVLLAMTIGFDRLFTLFHKVFFPGKDNWLFDPRYDQVINILPETFFMNCAILIGVIAFSISLILIINDYRLRKY